MPDDESMKELKQSVLDRDPDARRWCQFHGRVIRMDELIQVACSTCHFFIGNDGDCDPI